MAGIYIHIPFCKTRCIYCDFFSSASSGEKDNYINALCREIELRKDFLSGQEIRTVYFGGGTPSQLPVEDLKRIFDTLSCCELDTHASAMESTIEVNPDDVTEEYLRAVSPFFNRISMGVQSFQNKDLQFLNRRHTATQAINAITQCKKVGFENVSIDLMYGLPGQTAGEWKKNLEIAVSLQVQHISAYHLIYEEGTKLQLLLDKGKIKEVGEELSVLFYTELIQTLSKAGFIQYEISNFALPGYFSRHNSSYWDETHYWGLGASAHSYNGISRQWNVSSIHQYIRQINLGIVPAEIEMIDERMAYNDYIMTGLRTIRGIDLQTIESRFGLEKRVYCMQQASKHVLNKTLSLENETLRINGQGMFLSDGIMSDLMFVP